MSEDVPMTTAEKWANFAIGAGSIAPMALLRAVVLKDMWRWFVVPLNVAMISGGEALGLSLLVTYVTWTYVPNDERFSTILSFVRVLLVTLSAWGMGAIYARFR